jgi:hypothetical protein
MYYISVGDTAALYQFYPMIEVPLLCTTSSRESVGGTAALYQYYPMIEVPLLCTTSSREGVGDTLPSIFTTLW